MPYTRQVTQLGHVKDLATAFVKVLGNPKASRQVFNIAGERCAVCNKFGVFGSDWCKEKQCSVMVPRTHLSTQPLACHQYNNSERPLDINELC